MKNGNYHEPVMVQEVTNAFAPLDNARIIDATLGSAGHSLALIKAGANVLGIETDSQMLEIAVRRLEEARPTPLDKTISRGSFKLVKGNFKDIDQIAESVGFKDVGGVLFDLGVSNMQLKSHNRGFSFSNPEADLDMRIDPESQGVKASDLLNGLRGDQLISLFGETLDSGSAKWLTKRILNKRDESPIKTVEDFLKACEGLRTKKDLHEATLPLLALRITVNSERENLKEALPKAFSLLKMEGKVAVITFHSGEKKVVLDFFHSKKRENEGIFLTQAPIIPTKEEVANNPSARSAELWIFKKNETV